MIGSWLNVNLKLPQVASGQKNDKVQGKFQKFEKNRKNKKFQNFPKNTPVEHRIEAAYEIWGSSDDWKLVKSLPN